MDNREITRLISVDIRRAFDSINHKILLSKIHEQFGFRNLVLKWFRSFLTKQSQTCKVDGYASSAKTIICGVTQGFILGLPMLLININHLPEDLKTYTSSLSFSDLITRL